MRRVRPVSDFLWALSGPIVWAVHFFAIYAAEALICTARAPSGTAMRVATLVLTGAALLALFGIAYGSRPFPASVMSAGRGATGFLSYLTLALAAASALAVIWAALPGFALPVCAFSPG